MGHAEFHKHAAYILANADMPGFSRMEQQRLARIVLAHRGKLGKMQDVELEGSDWTLVFALRIAALVLRNRTDVRFPMLHVSGDKSGYSLDLPQAWLEENPLAAAALETESEHWESVDLRFSVDNLAVRTRRSPSFAAEPAVRAGPARAPRAPPPAPWRPARDRVSHHRPPFFTDHSASRAGQQHCRHAAKVRLMADDDRPHPCARASPPPPGCPMGRRPARAARRFCSAPRERLLFRARAARGWRVPGPRRQLRDQPFGHTRRLLVALRGELAIEVAPALRGIRRGARG